MHIEYRFAFALSNKLHPPFGTLKNRLNALGLHYTTTCNIYASAHVRSNQSSEERSTCVALCEDKNLFIPLMEENFVYVSWFSAHRMKISNGKNEFNNNIYVIIF